MKKIHSTTKYKTQHFELTSGEDFIKPDESRYELELTLPPAVKNTPKQLMDLAEKLISELQDIYFVCGGSIPMMSPLKLRKITTKEDKRQLYTVTLLDIGPYPARLISKLKEITGGSLKECKALMNKPAKDRMLASAISAEQASEIKNKLEAIGATINLKMNTKSVYQTLIG